MRGEPGRSLSSVIAVIPEECYEKPTWKGLLYVGRALLIYAVVLTTLFWADEWWLLPPLWLLAM